LRGWWEEEEKKKRKQKQKQEEAWMVVRLALLGQARWVDGLLGLVAFVLVPRQK
jgi:hypothetical protein